MYEHGMKIWKVWENMWKFSGIGREMNCLSSGQALRMNILKLSEVKRIMKSQVISELKGCEKTEAYKHMLLILGRS